MSYKNNQRNIISIYIQFLISDKYNNRDASKIRKWRKKKNDVEKSIIDFFKKMDKKIRKNGLSLRQVFKAYDIDKN